MTKRGPGAADWATVATIFAAAAAGLSAWAAFRQERATFTSQLYNQQVVQIGALVAAGNKLSGTLDADVQRIQELEYDVESRGSRVPEYRKSLSKLHEDISELDTLEEQTALVLPAAALPLQKDLRSATGSVQAAIARAGGLQCGGNSEADHCRIADLPAIGAGIQNYVAQTTADISKLQRCALLVLPVAGVLSDDSARTSRCDLRPVGHVEVPRARTVGGGTGPSGG